MEMTTVSIQNTLRLSSNWLSRNCLQQQQQQHHQHQHQHQHQRQHQQLQLQLHLQTAAAKATATAAVFGRRGLRQVRSPAGCFAVISFGRAFLSFPGCPLHMSTCNQDQSYRPALAKACDALAGSEQVAMRNATGQEDWSGSVRDAHVQFSAMRTLPEDMGQRQRQVPGHRWNVPVTFKCIRDASGASHGTTGNDAVGSSLEGRGGSQSGGDGRTGGRHHHQSEKRDQPNSNSGQWGKQLDVAKTALTQAATLMTKLHQEVAATGTKRRSGVGNAPEMCIADSERITIHTNPERRGRTCENSNWCGCSDRRNDGGDKDAPTARSQRRKEQAYSRISKQPWRCGLHSKQRKQHHYQENNWTMIWRVHC